METTLKIECSRHKLLGNKLYQIEIQFDIITLTDLSELPNKSTQIQINYHTYVDFKVKNEKLQAVGFITKKHHWYYADHESLMNLKQSLGGRVMFKGVNTLYNPLQQIGQGTFSNVYLLQNRLDSLEYLACKCLDKAQIHEQIGREGLLIEIKAMVDLKHPNIAELVEVLEGDATYYMVMKYYTLEFTDLLKEIQMEDVPVIFRQLVAGVKFMHDNGYMHRDIKPENIMFEDSIYQLKLIDFGLTTKEGGKSKCGTPGYVAPEILNLDTKINEYNEKCDIFSLGVIFYKMLTQNDLFQGGNHEEILQNNARCNINLDLLNGNQKISKKAIDLLKKMLDIDPCTRIDANQILSHSFFQIEETQIKSLTSLGQLSRKHSSVLKILSPIQKKNAIYNSPFSFHEEDYIECEAEMQPIPQVFMKGGSVQDIKQSKSKNRKLSKDDSKKYQTTDFEDVVQQQVQQHNYRPPKPNQLNEMYNKSVFCQQN